MLEIVNNIREKIIIMLTRLGLNSEEAVTIIVIILIIDVILLHKWNQAKKEFLMNQEESKNEDNERYVQYYKKKQYIYTIRWIMRVVVILWFVLYHNPNVFAWLAIALWAFVISFGSVFLSLGVYLYLVSFYTPWQSVKVGDYTGEIISITPLYLKLLWRNESGEHTGELISIPNHQVWQYRISLIDLDLSAIQKTIIEIHYNYESYHLSFDEFVPTLKSFLDELFPVNTPKIAHHYKSYKWYKYKLSYDIDKEWRTIMGIWFLCKRSKTPEFKYKIVSFLERLKKTAAKNTNAKKNTTSNDKKTPIINKTSLAPVGSWSVI